MFRFEPLYDQCISGCIQGTTLANVLFSILLYYTIYRKLQYNYSVIMKKITFEWDASKAFSNKRKHGVSFDEAKSAFLMKRR